MQTCLVKEEEHKEEKGQRWEERTRVGGEGEEEQGLRETMMMTSRRKCKKSGFGCNIFNIIKMIEEKKLQSTSHRIRKIAKHFL